MKKLVVFILVILISTGIFAQDVKKAYRPIKIGCEPDYPPFCLVDENGEGVGFSMDLLRAAANAVNLEYTVKVDLWSIVKQELAEGKLDALPLVGRTPEREPFFDFTFPYISLHGAIFTRKNDSTIRNISDLKSKAIIVMKGDNAEEYVRRDSLSNRIILTSTFEEAFKLLASGEHDAVVTQRVMGLQLLQILGIKNIIPLDIVLNNFRQDFCFAVTEGNKELLEKLNEGLATIISNGTYDEIYQKWFTPIMQESLTLKDKIRISLNFVIPTILIIALLLIFLMQREIRRKTSELKLIISQMEKSQIKLKESESKFKSYIDNSPIGIFVANEKGEYIEVNKAACEITGYRRDELLKMKISQMSPLNAEEAEKGFKSLKQVGRFSAEKEFVTSNGEIRYWRIDSVKLSEDQYLGFTIDTTDKWVTSRKLEETNFKLQQLFEHMNNGFAYHKMIIENDRPVDYIFLQINSAFEEMLGLREKDVIGRRVTEVIPGTENDPAGWIEIYGRVAITQEAIKFENYSKELKRWYSISAYSPKKGYFATVFNDITKRKIAESELEQYRDELEQKVKERTAELERKNEDLTRYNKVFVGREFRIKELRDKIAKLESKISDKT